MHTPTGTLLFWRQGEIHIQTHAQRDRERQRERRWWGEGEVASYLYGMTGTYVVFVARLSGKGVVVQFFSSAQGGQGRTVPVYRTKHCFPDVCLDVHLLYMYSIRLRLFYFLSSERLLLKTVKKRRKTNAYCCSVAFSAPASAAPTCAHFGSPCRWRGAIPHEWVSRNAHELVRLHFTRIPNQKSGEMFSCFPLEDWIACGRLDRSFGAC